MGSSMDVYFQVEEIESIEKLMNRIRIDLIAVKTNENVEIGIKKVSGIDKSHVVCKIQSDTWEFLVTTMTQNTNPQHDPPIPEGFFYVILSGDTSMFTFRDFDNETIKRSSKVTQYFIKYAKAIYLLLKPIYAVGANELALEANKYDFEDKIYWLNFFSPIRVKEIGYEKVISAPANKIECLQDGSMLLLAAENPLMVRDDVVNKISRHLGLRLHEK